MVKGVARRVVVIRSPEPRLFDEAIFIVRDGALSRTGVTNEELQREATAAAESYIRQCRGSASPIRLPAPVWAGIGALATGLIWALTAIL